MYKLKTIPEDFIVNEIASLNLLSSGKYSIFELRKRDMTTEKAMQSICKKFSIKRKNIGFAGNKDRRAITTQNISILGNASDFESKDITIRRIGFSDEPISLGDLKGNSFEIVIRNLEKRPKKADFCINYFDEQRFSEHNLEIGLAILRKDFNKASKLIDHKDCVWHLEKFRNDYIGAIKKVPLKIRQMYIHSVQSFFWNEAAKKIAMKEGGKHRTIKYSLGEFVFLEEEIKDMMIPLITFDTEFKNNEIEIIFEEILDEYGLTARDFIIRAMPEITPMGNERGLISRIKDLSFGEFLDDDMTGKKKMKVSFTLDKGSYATMAVKKMIRE